MTSIKISIPFIMKRLQIYCLIAFLFYGCTPDVDDNIAIKKLLEKESATWRSGDAKGHADCWNIEPGTSVLVSTADGRAFDVPVDKITNPAPGSMGKGGRAENSNYKISIEGNMAFVTHKELSYTTDNSKSYSYEMRILKKINGEWKLVAQSIHLYDPGKQAE